MKLYNIIAGGLTKKKFKDLHVDIKKGIRAVSSIAGINSVQVGTSSYKNMKYFGDVDLFSQLDPDKIPQLVKAIQKIVRKLPDSIWFSDAKIGGTAKKGIHWTKRQIIAGKHKKLLIEDALRQKAITKIDIIVPVKTEFGDRYVEFTNFLFIPGVSAPFGDFIKSMDDDIKKYHRKNRRLKVLKRKLSKLLFLNKKKDQREINKLSKIIGGRPGRLASMIADCEVARLLVGNKKLQKLQLSYLSRVMERKITMNNLGDLEKEVNREVNKAVEISLNK